MRKATVKVILTPFKNFLFRSNFGELCTKEDEMRQNILLESQHKSEAGVLQLSHSSGEECQKLLTKLQNTTLQKSSKAQLAVVYEVEDI